MSFPFPRRHKYNAVKCRCAYGHVHDSRKEAGDCAKLHMMQKGGAIKDIETQVRFVLSVNGVKICEHRVDFLVTTNEGTQEVYESKGFATREWEFKRRLFEALNPEIKYNVWR